VIAQATGETLNPERIQIYLRCLDGAPYERLLDALARCPAECKWFPKIPELLEMAGCGPQSLEAQLDAEAEAAWLKLEKFLWRHYHPDLGIHGYESGGKHHPPPKLDARTEIALRAVGGPSRISWAINQEGDESQYGWIKREFIAAWKRAPAVQQHLLSDAETLKTLTGAHHPVTLGQKIQSPAGVIRSGGRTMAADPEAIQRGGDLSAEPAVHGGKPVA